MINLEVGDIIFFSNGQKMRILKNREKFLFVCIKTWEVYLELNDIEHIYQFGDDNGIYIEGIVKSRDVSTVQAI
jgi:hypothetical protein